MKTARNHKFSFAGLSGTLVVNEKGEFAGIVTAGPLPRLEYDPSGKIKDISIPEGYKVVADTINLTPFFVLEDLFKIK